jgi:hypothetical protein
LNENPSATARRNNPLCLLPILMTDTVVDVSSETQQSVSTIRAVFFDLDGVTSGESLTIFADFKMFLPNIILFPPPSQTNQLFNNIFISIDFS